MQVWKIGIKLKNNPMRSRYIKILILTLFLFVGGLPFLSSSAVYGFAASLKGDVYMMFDGTKYYLKNISIYRRFASTPDCQIGSNPSSIDNCQNWTAESPFYSDDPGVASSYTYHYDWANNQINRTRWFESAGKYRYENSLDPTYRGIVKDDATSTTGCGANTCGINCGYNEWRAEIPGDYGLANFPGGYNFRSGSFDYYPNYSESTNFGSGASVMGVVTEENSQKYLWIHNDNDEGHTGWDIEWTPNCPASAPGGLASSVPAGCSNPGDYKQVALSWSQVAGATNYAFRVNGASARLVGSMPVGASDCTSGSGNALCINSWPSTSITIEVLSGNYDWWVHGGNNSLKNACALTPSTSSSFTVSACATPTLPPPTATPTITPTPTFAPTPTPAAVVNCYNLSGSGLRTQSGGSATNSTIYYLYPGEQATFTAGYNMNQEDLAGDIYIAKQSDKSLSTCGPTDDQAQGCIGKDIIGTTGQLSHTWTAPSLGANEDGIAYDVMCRGFSRPPAGWGECRGNAAYISGTITTCSGPQASMEVRVYKPPAQIFGTGLTVDIGSDGVVGSKYGISGLRTNELDTTKIGKRYYNALKVQPKVSNENYNMLAAVFSGQITNSLPSNYLTAVMGNMNGGFILARIQKTDAYLQSVNANFYDNSYWIYYNGSWTEISSDGSPRTLNLNGVKSIEVSFVSQQSSLLNQKEPIFDIKIYNQVQSKAWSTYTFLRPNLGEQVLQ